LRLDSTALPPVGNSCWKLLSAVVHFAFNKLGIDYAACALLWGRRGNCHSSGQQCCRSALLELALSRNIQVFSRPVVVLLMLLKHNRSGKTRSILLRLIRGGPSFESVPTLFWQGPTLVWHAVCRDSLITSPDAGSSLRCRIWAGRGLRLCRPWGKSRRRYKPRRLADL
jgi:hypothetical protein